MDAITAIFNRRSIRQYVQNKPLCQQQIDTILAAGCAAPSAHNGQPWEFVVVQDKATIKKLADVKVYYKKPLKEAPLAIVVLINTLSNDRDKLEYQYQDCSAATQNMMIAATALGLGSCQMGGLLQEDEIAVVNDILALPKHILFFGLVSFGYPAETKEPHGKISTQKVHYAKY